MPTLGQACHCALARSQFCLYVFLLTISNHTQPSRLSSSPTSSRKPPEISPMLSFPVLPPGHPENSIVLWCPDLCKFLTLTRISSPRKGLLLTCFFLTKTVSPLIHSLKLDSRQLKQGVLPLALRFKPPWFQYTGNSLHLLHCWYY